MKYEPPREYDNNVTDYILVGVDEGLFIVVLDDTSVGHSHIIGINRGLNNIYDCMKTHKRRLNHVYSFKILWTQSSIRKIHYYSRAQGY